MINTWIFYHVLTYGEKNQQLVFARLRKMIPTAKMRWIFKWNNESTHSHMILTIDLNLRFVNLKYVLIANNWQYLHIYQHFKWHWIYDTLWFQSRQKWLILSRKMHSIFFFIFCLPYSLCFCHIIDREKNCLFTAAAFVLQLAE